MIFAFKSSVNYKEQHLFLAIYRKYYIAKKVNKWDIYIYTYIYYTILLYYSWYLKAVKVSIFMFLKY